MSLNPDNETAVEALIVEATRPIRRSNFLRMRPQDMPPHMAGKPHDGWRLRLEQEPGENAVLVEERVLPERLDRPDAQRVEEADVVWLTTDEARWLLDALTELVPVMEADLARDQAALDARKDRK